ncbi:MAG TPA: sortase [Ilumatobacteraceae bacterium]
MIGRTAAAISRRRMLALAAGVPVAATLLTSQVAGAVRPDTAQTLFPEAAAVPSGATSFSSVTPYRLADTRPEYGVGGYTRLTANIIRVVVAGRGGVPQNATTAVLNVTVVNMALAGYVTVFPAGGQVPLVSNVNIDSAGQQLPNLATVALGAGGAVDIYAQNVADIIVDVNGAYVPVSEAVSAGRFVALPSAARVLDTRVTGGTVGIGGTARVSVASVVPATASAVVVNLTVTNSNGGGYWTGYPAGGTPPNSSSVNTDGPGQTRANQAILPIGTVGATRGIDVFASSGGDLIVDVAGYFTGASDPVGTDGLFVPNPPYRTLDTRLVSRYGRMYAGWVCEFDYTGRAQSQAVVVNLTAAATRAPGYFTGYPARTTRPLASNLNSTYVNQTIANHAILRTSSVGVAVYTQGGADVIVDVAGYFTGVPAAATLSAPNNVVPPPPPPAALPYVLNIPALGITAKCVEGISTAIVNANLVGHWPGTGFAGEQSHQVYFAHRTTGLGIFRYLNLLGPGNEITLSTGDGRVFHYAYQTRNITGQSAAEIYNVGLVAPLPSVSLVACSKTNYLPTDTSHRIVVTFSLTSVDGE